MTAPAAPVATPKGRLGNGQLRGQVARYLADNPGLRKAGEIAKNLGRSAGACRERIYLARVRLFGHGRAGLPVRCCSVVRACCAAGFGGWPFFGIVRGHGDLSSAGAGRMARGRWMAGSAERPGRIRRKQSPARRRARVR
jgi:hypothetical protein